MVPFVELSQSNPESFLPPADWLKCGKVSRINIIRNGFIQGAETVSHQWAQHAVLCQGQSSCRMINTGEEQQILLSFYSNLPLLYGMKKITFLQPHPLWTPCPSSCDAGEGKEREKGAGLTGGCASCTFSSPLPMLHLRTLLLHKLIREVTKCDAGEADSTQDTPQGTSSGHSLLPCSAGAISLLTGPGSSTVASCVWKS